MLIIGEKNALECRILDFCSGGFYLVFDKKHPAIELNKNIKIRFSIRLEFELKTFEVDAQITHIGSTGVGVVTEQIPATTFNALKKIASPGSLAPVHDSSGTSPENLNQENYKNSFKQFLIESLPTLIDGFFVSLGDCLDAANTHSEFFPTSSAFDDLITTLKLNREIINSEFCCSVIYQVDFISSNTEKTSEALYHESLSLIEKEDFEDWLNMSASIRKLKNYFDDELSHLVRELCRVFGVFDNTVNNPIGPAVLCDSFREIFLQLELGCNVKKAIYNCFEKTLIIELPNLYKQAIATLTKFESARIVASGYSGQGSRSFDNQKIEKNQVYFNDFLDAEPLSGRKVVQPITQVTGKLLNLLSETVGISADNGYEESSLPLGHTQAVFNPAEVLSAIAKIQNDIAAKSNTHLDSATLQKSLTDKLRANSPEAKSLSVDDVQRLELYGKFFDALVGELEFSTDIKNYLESIYLPLLSLPLQGNDFLDSESHPARKILNQLAVLDPAIKSNRVIKNTNIKNTVEKAIARISAESISNPKVFAEVEHELDSVTKKLAQSNDANIKRIIEPYEGQQKLEMARLAIQQEVDKRIAGRSVPSIIPTLLDAGWQDLLVIAELNKDANPDEKLSYLKVIDDLLFWLYEQESFLNMQAVSIHTTLKFIEENLGAVCPNLFKRDSVIEELFSLLIGSGVPKVRKPMDSVRIPTPKSNPNIIESERAAQVAQLQVGEWLIIYKGSEGFEPMKLVWIGDILPICVFVNRDGLTKLELSKTELAQLLENGGANRIESLDVPLMDRATNQMLQNMHSKLIYNATHDAETDLFTKDEFIKQLKVELIKLDSTCHLLCHIEVLDFRVITNVCGVAGGKQFLKTLTQLIREQLPDCDLFARIGDKSFALLLKDCSTESGYDLFKKLLKTIGESRFQWQDKSYTIGVSIGLVPFEQRNFDINELLQNADAASMSAERSGPNNVLIFTNDDENLKRQNKIYEWIGNIDKVFSENRLFLRCQMITAVDETSASHQHYEILLGIKDENDNIIPPDHFIPAVERAKRMPEIDQWVITNVLMWIENNRNYFDNIDGFAINLSGQSINSEEFLGFLKGILESTSVPTNKLVFEVTETVAAESFYLTNSFIKAIKQFDCKFSLDDFGSGYSSYSYLKNLNIDYLKIDGAFVKDILNSKADIAIVKSMNEIAHSLGLATIAEYVENAEIREVLKTIGVDFAQGYGVHKPMPLSELVVDLPSAPFFSFEDTEFWGF
ncbi:hypothetical protein A1342_08080 [Methylomonas methanica]|uniref:Diguanylate cyclase n=1 Tax=Methylomonas denitrificans TaxID=1538553 RepID=A0A140E6Y9_9GAMM|nr:hypothetical protein JT25_022215 [Methylomonas denitrificans]OAH99667.1 hypothetical protein A1342_08080 [Methylomonas methanica]